MIDEVQENEARAATWIALVLIVAFFILSVLTGCPGLGVTGACTKSPDGTITCGITVNKDGSKHVHAVEKTGE